MSTSNDQLPPPPPRLRRVRRSAPREGGTSKAEHGGQLRIFASSDRAGIDRLIGRRARTDPQVERAVRRIVDDVRRRGDDALVEYARRFDGLEGAIEVSRREMRSAARRVPAPVRAAISLAAENIRRIARKQVPRAWRHQTTSGVTVEQRVIPLQRVGCYVPAGRYPLSSSLLMTVVPAKTAGVGEVVVVCPRPQASIMYAALEAGADRLLRIGGAHAIAALAYGTATIRNVDKIVGPGNAYVAAAKALVARDCAIDFFAGPSEIVVISTNGRPDWIAADLIAQAEHDQDARAILVTPSERLAEAVLSACARQLPSRGTAAAALANNGGIILTRSAAEAIALCERIAPEHAVCDNDSVAAKLTSAGTIFVGRYAAQALGDYLTGSNHVLPTGGAARLRGGLSAADFVKLGSIQRLNRDGAARLARAAVTLARAEGLEAHARSIEMRLEGGGL